MPSETYKAIDIRLKYCYVLKNDEMYIQEVDQSDLHNLKVGMNIMFKLGQSVRIYGRVSRLKRTGFFVKNWSINNKGEKFANEHENS